jgi:uncharacterized protein (DUF488 family)
MYLFKLVKEKLILNRVMNIFMSEESVMHHCFDMFVLIKLI